MWKAVEKALGPGFNRDKCEVKLVGTPLTHQRFLRRNRGTYGPAILAGKIEVDLWSCSAELISFYSNYKITLILNLLTHRSAGKGTFPGHSTPIPQLMCCGDSTFPGIGVPAVAASGAIVANSLVSVSEHSRLLDAIGI